MKRLLKSLICGLLWQGVAVKVRRENPQVIAVTGSVAKTTTKEAMVAVLKQSGRPVISAKGNFNTETGVPLGILGVSETPQGISGWGKVLWRVLRPPKVKGKKRPYYVVEYSADKPGDIAYLARHLPPDTGILTWITPVHLQAYPKFEDLIAEKTSLITGIKSGGQAFLNSDDPVQVEWGKQLANARWYGIRDTLSKEPGVWAHHLQFTDKGWKMQIDSIVQQRMDGIGRSGRQNISVQTTLTGKHQLYSLLIAAAIGFAEHVAEDKIKAALESYQVPPGRGRLIPGQKDTLIIDDSYNSSPASVKAGLDSLTEVAGERRKVAILGTMNELGEEARKLHEEVAEYAVGKVDYLIVLGQFGEKMRASAKQAGLSSHQVIHFLQPAQLIDKLDQVIKRGDLIFIKGSQNGMRLERVVKKLMAHPEQAEQLLARQSAYWKQKP